MELRDALKAFRAELNITQLDLANALHVNVTIISRWELGKSFPNRSVVSLLLGYAYTRCASADSMNSLRQALNGASKKKRDEAAGLSASDNASLAQIIEDASFPIYVCDLESCDMLYMNRTALNMAGYTSRKAFEGKKCYECIMHRDKPCRNCNKSQLKDNPSFSFDIFHPTDSNLYRIRGKLLRWNGREAQLRYILDSGHSISVRLREEPDRERAYNEQLKARTAAVSDCVASFHLNLTENRVTEANCHHDGLRVLLSPMSADSILKLLALSAGQDRELFDIIDNRDALIHLYYGGKNRISVEHRLEGENKHYETVIDLFQHPVNFSVEAFIVIRCLD